MKKLVLSLVLVGAFGFASAQEAPKEHHCRHSEHKKMEREKGDRAEKEKLRERHQRKLKKILTPEQYEKWQSNHPRRKDERRMPPPPPMEQPEIKGN